MTSSPSSYHYYYYYYYYYYHFYYYYYYYYYRHVIPARRYMLDVSFDCSGSHSWERLSGELSELLRNDHKRKLDRVNRVGSRSDDDDDDHDHVDGGGCVVVVCC